MSLKLAYLNLHKSQPTPPVQEVLISLTPVSFGPLKNKSLFEEVVLGLLYIMGELGRERLRLLVWGALIWGSLALSACSPMRAPSTSSEMGSSEPLLDDSSPSGNESPDSSDELSSEEGSVEDSQNPDPPQQAPDVSFVWVEKWDGSYRQFPGGARALAQDRSLLATKNIRIYTQEKALAASLIQLPVDPKNALTTNQYPSQKFPSSVVNSYKIAQADLQKALSLGFRQRPRTTVSAQSCAGAQSILAFGQSNSANSGARADTSVHPNILMFFNGHCFPARDPLLGASIYNGGGSIWMPFAKRYVRDHPGQKLVLVSFGVGGSSSQEWTPSGKWHSRMVRVLRQVREARLNVKKVFWHQGESDNLQEVSTAQYMNHFEQILSTLRQNQIEAPVSIAVASYLGFMPYNMSLKIQKAQIQLVEKHSPLVELGINTDFFHTPYRAKDDVHLNATGLQAIADEWYKNALSPSRPSPDELMVQAIFQVLVHRRTAPSEESYWIGRKNQRGGWASVISEVEASEEAFIKGLYTKYTRRIPERPGYNEWRQILGSTTRAELEARFAQLTADIFAGRVGYPTSLFYKEDGILKPWPEVYRFDRSAGFWEVR